MTACGSLQDAPSLPAVKVFSREKEPYTGAIPVLLMDQARVTSPSSQVAVRARHSHLKSEGHACHRARRCRLRACYHATPESSSRSGQKAQSARSSVAPRCWLSGGRVEPCRLAWSLWRVTWWQQCKASRHLLLSRYVEVLAKFRAWHGGGESCSQGCPSSCDVG